MSTPPLNMLSRVVGCFAVAVSVALVGCSNETVLPPTPGAITLSGATEVRPGAESDTLIALVASAEGRPVSGIALSWAIDDPTADLIVVDAETDEEGRGRAVVRGGTSLSGQEVAVTAANLPAARRLLVAVAGTPRGPIWGPTADQPFCGVATDGRLLCEALPGFVWVEPLMVGRFRGCMTRTCTPGS